MSFNVHKLNPGRIIVLLGIFFNGLCAQQLSNLVPNGSMESYTACTNGSVINTVNWFRAAYHSSTDYFHSCSTYTPFSVPVNALGSQAARTGNGYFGFSLYYKEIEGREDIETKLKQALQAGKKYCVTYYLSLAEYSRFAISNFGAYFTIDSLKNYPPMPWPPAFHFLTPSVENPITNIIADTINWVPVQMIYTANGGENFITITNFRNDANTNFVQIKPLTAPSSLAYYYIDDVSVIEINPAKVYSTPTIISCANSTFTLGTDSTEDATYAWFPTTGLSCTNCPNPIITATANTKYVLTKQQCSATTKDSVYIQIYTPTLTAVAGNFKSICSNDTVTLGRNDTTFFSSYQWLPPSGLSCTNCPQPVAMPFASTTYTLNRTECSFTTQDTVTIFVEDCEVKIPNIFTPNNDNVNDEWKIKLPFGFKFTAAAVYDRWGTLVYQIEDEVLRSPLSKIRSVIWDGRTNAGLECSAGVYYYVLHYEDKKGEVKKLNGTILLVR